MSSGRPRHLRGGGWVASALRPILVGRSVLIEWEEKAELKAAWGAWLTEQEWDAFITVTFRSPRKAAHALSTLNGIQRVIERTEHPDGLFLGTEPHLSNSIHVHGLIRWMEQPYVTKQTLQRITWRNLFKAFGRSQVAVPRIIGGVAGYVSKYVLKYDGEYLVG